MSFKERLDGILADYKKIVGCGGGYGDAVIQGWSWRDVPPVQDNYGHPQAYVAYMLQDQSYEPRIIHMDLIDAVPGRTHDVRANHGAVSVADDETGQIYVVDPLFFSRFRGVMGQSVAPEKFLTGPAGREVLEALGRDGCFVATPERAHAYVTAFCCGQQPFDAPTAMSFLCDPIRRHPALTWPRNEIINDAAMANVTAPRQAAPFPTQEVGWLRRRRLPAMRFG